MDGYITVEYYMNWKPIPWKHVVMPLDQAWRIAQQFADGLWPNEVMVVL